MRIFYDYFFAQFRQHVEELKYIDGFEQLDLDFFEKMLKEEED